MTVKIAMHMDLMDAIFKLPKEQQSKMRKFILEFQKNPTASGFNFERIKVASNDRFRSVRIDQSYRAILYKPEFGNTYLFMWVDHHDAAYAWAERKQLAINPETGAIQIFTLEDVETKEDNDGNVERSPLFGAFRDRELKRIGVPEALLPLVRSFQSQTDLLDHEGELPKDAFEALFFLSEGESFDDIARYQDQEAMDEMVDTEDFEAALDRPETRRIFVVADDEFLEEMLAAPLDKWRVFLHPSQRRLVSINANGPIRVLGGAGTGKTVVAMHRAERVAREVCKDDEKILFTTFTKNLAADIKSNLRLLCDEKTFKKIEVVNFDYWVATLLQSSGVDFSMAYGKQVDNTWSSVFSELPIDDTLPESFYREEFDSIILDHGVESLQDYFRVSRVGRGTPLTRQDRARIWPVFEQYRSELTRKGLKEPKDAFRHARSLLNSAKQRLPYRSIIVDEAQDMSPQAIKLIRAIVPAAPQDIFIVGDAHQRIYGRPFALSPCGIEIRGRSRRLRINYRTPEEVRNWAVGILKGVEVDDLDDGRDSLSGFRSLLHGEPPLIRKFDSFAEEVSFIIDRIKELSPEGKTRKGICLVARTKDALNHYRGALMANNIWALQIEKTEADDPSKPGIRLATMHRVKGIEFDHIIVASVNQGLVPLYHAIGKTSDGQERALGAAREKALLYVAATRAKKTLTVTCYGEPSELLY